ncbi:MAG: hypothetical protein U5P41_08995 [Gammaproteobacteria bacterium]|nr:hypothetical protein [Gammaproteobacteria bacterium]
MVLLVHGVKEPRITNPIEGAIRLYANKRCRCVFFLVKQTIAGRNRSKSLCTWLFYSGFFFMRILTVVAHLGYGGNERVAQNFSLIYKMLGMDVAVLAINRGGPRANVLVESGIEVFTCNKNDADTENLLQKVLSWQPDLVHLHKAGINDHSLIERLRSGVPDTVPFIEKQSFSKPSDHTHLVDVSIHQTKWCMWKFEALCKLQKIKPIPYSAIIPNPTDASSFLKMSPLKSIIFVKRSVFH